MNEHLDTGSGFLFKGNRYFSQKSHGSQRSKPPSETLSEIKELLIAAGVTRLADITGLDKIGVPVTLAIRPTSRTIAVSSGKGVDLVTAMTSGAMESLELHHAEFAKLDYIYCTYSELTQAHNCLRTEELPLRSGEAFNARWPETWTLGWDIVNQQEVAVPIQAALMAPNLTEVRFPSIAAFVTDSNGLASGNDIVEAVLSGLLETIERDAIALHKIRSEISGSLVGKINVATVPYESVQRLKSRIERSGARLALFDCTSDTKVPTFRAAILNDARGVGQIVEGFGTHLSNEMAMLRAITEACQGRAVVIAGARDDVFHFALERVAKADYRRSIAAIDDQQMLQFHPHPESISNYIHKDLNSALHLLQEVNVTQVIVVELKMFDCEQTFVKVIVPGLEGYPGSGYRPRRRALSLTRNLSRSEGNSSGLKSTLFHSQAGGNHG